MRPGRVRRRAPSTYPGAARRPPGAGRKRPADAERGSVVSDELVMGRFRIEERIGSGGMGTVYRAFDERLQRDVAVKEIERAGAERVLREAQAAARLNHPAIVTLYELGERDGHALPGLRAGRRARHSTSCPRRRASPTATSPRSAPTSATRWRTPTSAASCTATSSRRT